MNSLILFIFFAALLSGLIPLAWWKYSKLAKFSSFLFLCMSGLSAIIAGGISLFTQKTFVLTINSSFPLISWHFCLDSLAGFFMTLVGLIVVSVAVYGPGYVRGFEKERSIVPLQFFTGLFVIGMYLVILAHDVFSFMLAWELMSVSSYFLVVYHHENSNNRHAGLVYFLMAQVSGLLILFAYCILVREAGDLSFNALSQVHLNPMWASLAFLLAFLGFGMKAGIVPVHVWLPQAHPVAPSHISALMSGVMLKVAVYGFIRFSFGLLHQSDFYGSGMVVLAVGVVSALLGVLYALMQNDLKKLLAYSSIENVGIIFIGLGLSFIFINAGYPYLAALGFIAALYHCLNHALFKSLLFLGAGAVLQHTHEHDLEHMGGLIKSMPYTAWFFLVGCISISALPPFNGFVSEWLTFQTALQAVILKSAILRTLIPVAAALLALTSALAAACFVKLFGVAFLGQERTRHVRRAHDPSFGMRFAMGMLSLLCLLFGLLPVFTVSILNNISRDLIGIGLLHTDNWLWLVPLPSGAASYSALIVAIGIIVVVLIAILGVFLCCRHAKIRVALPWDCGFGGINSRMQYSATAFAMPIRRVFRSVWPVSEKIERNNGKINYWLQVGDWVWKYCYEPLAHFSIALARLVARLQGGNVRVYLGFAFAVLIILLWVIA